MSGKDATYPPYNFSWVVPGKLACAGWPRSVENIRFLADQGVTHLVTLSQETRPPLDTTMDGMNWTEIPVREFEAPTLTEINRFIAICQRARSNGDVICVHCHQGCGRTGVMAACYFARFQDLPPERAIMNLRLLRPGSVETYEQERAVTKYHDALRHVNFHDGVDPIDDSAEGEGRGTIAAVRSHRNLSESQDEI